MKERSHKQESGGEFGARQSGFVTKIRSALSSPEWAGVVIDTLMLGVMLCALIIAWHANALTSRAVRSSNDNAEEANRLTRKALQIHQRDVQIHTRPLLVFRNFRVADAPLTDADGQDWPRSVTMDIRNLTDFPAVDLQAKNSLSIDKRVIHVTATAPAGGCAKDDPVLVMLNLTMEQWALVTNSRASVFSFEVLYRGVLESTGIEYMSSAEIKYDPKATPAYSLGKHIYR